MLSICQVDETFQIAASLRGSPSKLIRNQEASQCFVYIFRLSAQTEDQLETRVHI